MKIHKFGLGEGDVNGAEQERCRAIARKHRAVFMTTDVPVPQYWFETHSEFAHGDERVQSAVLAEVGAVQIFVRPPSCPSNTTAKPQKHVPHRPTRILYTPPYSRAQQLHFCVRLGEEFHRWQRYAPRFYDSKLESLRALFRSIRADTLSPAWTMEDVEQALGERRLGPKPMSTKPSCSCVPFPGSWSPDVRSVGSHWHDRAVRMCLTCGEKRVRTIEKSMWPRSRALTIDLYGTNPTNWPAEVPF